MERLQKALARAGMASRRTAERWIAEGRVSVNGEIIQQLGSKVDPAHDSIKVDGKRIPTPAHNPTYLMLNKPRGCVTTVSDPQNRKTVLDLVRRVRRRLYPVGRLDYHSEGLLLLTDDGELARNLTHPSRRIEKAYEIKVRGCPEPEALRKLAHGVLLDGRQTLPARLRLIRKAANSWLEIVIVEGRKHHVRRMLQAVGHPVLKLRRVRLGGLRLGKLPPGSFRPLSTEEVALLRQSSAGEAAPRPERRRPGPT